MENESNNSPAMCQSGCGFFGSSERNGYCSVCYKKVHKNHQEEQQQQCRGSQVASTARPKRPATLDIPALTNNNVPAARVQVFPKDHDDSGNKEIEKKGKNRCKECRKKVGLTAIVCRCGGMYCGQHRYSDKHNCTFDYRAVEIKKIETENPVIKAEKLSKI